MALMLEELDDGLMKEAAFRTSKRIEEINRTIHLISSGRGIEAESQSRLDEFSSRQKSLLLNDEIDFSYHKEQVAPKILINNVDASQDKSTKKIGIGLERKIGPDNDILSIEFLEAGLLASKSVGRINGYGTSFGTGFIVGHQVLMTNHHVLSDPKTAENFTFELNVEESKLGKSHKIYEYQLNPERFFLTNKKLDFTLVAIIDDPIKELDNFGWHALLRVQGKIRKGDTVNIIQHPEGNNKKIVVHNSYFLHLENDTDLDQFCWYSGDTEEGSSGAPVFNNRWEIVALHHKAVPKTNRKGEIVDKNGHAMSEKRVKDKPEDIAWIANEGIRASRLVKAIEDATISNPTQEKIRNNLIELWNEPGAHMRGLRVAENDTLKMI